MKKNFLILVTGTCLGPAAFGQNWVAAGVPSHFTDLWQVYSDSVTDAVYFCGIGQFTLNGNFGSGIFRYHDAVWDTLGVVNGWNLTTVLYHDTLLLGGVFQVVNGDSSFANIAYFDGGAWHSYGNFDAHLFKLRVLDGELYAAGVFTYADGHLCHGLAKRVGGEWVNVGDFGNVTNWNLMDVIKYQGHLVVGGVAYVTGEGGHVFEYDGSTWTALGGGIFGNSAGVYSLAVFQGDLYVGGSYFISAGNTGQSIMRWDGSQWHALGPGIQIFNNSYQYPGSVYGLTVHDDLLFASGGFSFAGHVPASCVATWNGSRWCGLGGEFLGHSKSTAFYHDTLFAGANNTVDGMIVDGAVKFIGPDYEDTCSVAYVGIEEYGSASSALQLINTGDGQWSITGLSDGAHIVSVVDALGQLVASRRVTSERGSTTPLTIGAGSAGICLLKVDDRIVLKAAMLR